MFVSKPSEVSHVNQGPYTLKKFNSTNLTMVCSAIGSGGLLDFC